MRLRSILLLCIVALLMGGMAINSPAGQQTDTWLGNGDSTWSNSANWTSTGPTLPPVSGDALVFGAAGTSGVNLDNNLTSGAFSLSGITFSPGAAAFVIGNGTTNPNAGNTFLLTGNVSNNSTAAETINNPFTLNGPQTFASAGGGSITLGGVISGGGGITAAGGTLLVTNVASTFTGNVLVSSGTLISSANLNIDPDPISTSLGNSEIASRTITVGSGATLQFAAGNILGGGQSAIAVGLIIDAGGSSSTRPRRTATTPSAR